MLHGRNKYLRHKLAGLGIAMLFAAQSPSQTATTNAAKIGDVTISGWLRSRAMYFDWFAPAGGYNNNYAYNENIFRLAFSQTKEKWEWKIELAAPVILGLPSNAVAPGGPGQLGLGASYYAGNHNSNNTAYVFAKQAYLKWKFIGGGWKQSLELGRSEFFDGMEVTPNNATLAAVKKDRIAQRLIGNFGFTDVGRSFDGGVYTADRGRNNVTLFASRPTRGVFQVDGWGETNMEVYYGALTHQFGGGENAGDLRVFGVGYHDGRDSVLKTDNRPQTIRAADHGTIAIGTAGAHYIHALKTSAGTIDVLLWGVLQGGTWGTLEQRSAAYAAEGGWQPAILTKVRPWIRGGFNYGSGDKNPNDGTHGTFFQILPTARQYARYPFFNMMNTRDAFGELILRPDKKWVVRTDVHSLALANRNDLWYQGGGVFQPWTFGFVGRPSNGNSGLATLFDTSADYAINTHVAVAAYYAHASGKSVTQALYPKNGDSNFGYLEFNYRF